MVLDLNLPHVDGMTVLRELRKTDCETKVLILSARGEVSDKVDGLDAGANDYLTKPFHLDELAARIRSLALRRFAQSDIVLTCGKLSFDTKARIASVGSEALSLTRKETGILEYLMLNQGDVYKRQRDTLRPAQRVGHFRCHTGPPRAMRPVG